MTNNFKNTVNNIYQDFSCAGFDNVSPEFYNGEKEYGTFKFYKDYSFCEDMDHNLFEDDVKNSLSSLETDFGIKFKKIEQDFGIESVYEATLGNLKICVTTVCKHFLCSENYQGVITFEITGKELKSQHNFKEFPDIIPGIVFYTSWGYNQTRVEYYRVVRRSGNTIYTKRALTSSEQVFRSKIHNDKSTKINGHYAILWDGKAKHFSPINI